MTKQGRGSHSSEEAPAAASADTPVPVQYIPVDKMSRPIEKFLQLADQLSSSSQEILPPFLLSVNLDTLPQFHTLQRELTVRRGIPVVPVCTQHQAQMLIQDYSAAMRVRPQEVGDSDEEDLLQRVPFEGTPEGEQLSTGRMTTRIRYLFTALRDGAPGRLAPRQRIRWRRIEKQTAARKVATTFPRIGQAALAKLVEKEAAKAGPSAPPLSLARLARLAAEAAEEAVITGKKKQPAWVDFLNAPLPDGFVPLPLP